MSDAALSASNDRLRARARPACRHPPDQEGSRYSLQNSMTETESAGEEREEMQIDVQ